MGERREEEEEENPKFSISIEHGHGQPETTWTCMIITTMSKVKVCHVRQNMLAYVWVMMVLQQRTQNWRRYFCDQWLSHSFLMNHTHIVGTNQHLSLWKNKRNKGIGSRGTKVHMMQAMVKVVKETLKKDVTSHLFLALPFPPSSCSYHPYKPHSVSTG